MAKESWMTTPIELPALPWEKGALSPVISEQTIDFHYGKHHQAYVTKTGELVQGTELEGATIEEIIIATRDNPDKKTLFNNAAQVWNHNFYWKCLTPPDTSVMPQKLAAMIEKDFGSVGEFKKQLAAAGGTQFGSGWAWVVLEAGKLSIVKTPNADQPWKDGLYAVLIVDVWEHAYYLDYQNRRPAHLEAVIDRLINWEYMLHCIERAEA